MCWNSICKSKHSWSNSENGGLFLWILHAFATSVLCECTDCLLTSCLPQTHIALLICACVIVSIQLIKTDWYISPNNESNYELMWCKQDSSNWSINCQCEMNNTQFIKCHVQMNLQYMPMGTYKMLLTKNV